jgi:Trk K+ transport system NAD-binding subunit
MRRQFVVVGLGRLGLSMVGTLDSLGHEVLALDKREELTLELADVDRRTSTSWPRTPRTRTQCGA